MQCIPYFFTTMNRNVNKQTLAQMNSLGIKPDLPGSRTGSPNNSCQSKSASLGLRHPRVFGLGCKEDMLGKFAEPNV